MHDHTLQASGGAGPGEGASGARGKRLLFVILFNAVITMAEFIGGMLSGSLALISDAGHNLSDVLSLVLGFAGERVSGRKADRAYSFGLKRFEVLVALVNSVSLLGIGVYIVYEAVRRYMRPVPIDPGILIPVAFVGLAGNVFSILILRRERNASLNLRAAFLHLFYDALASLGVVAVGVVLLFERLLVLDLIVSLVIVLMILWSSLGIIGESMRIFLQGTPRRIDPDEVYRAILSVEKVAGLHGLHIWSINSSEIFLSCHICMAAEEDQADTDTVIGRVNAVLADRFGIDHTTLQVEVDNLCGMTEGTCCR